MYCPNWGTKSMAWWKTPVTLLLVQPRSQESCNKPMISKHPPVCYRTMTNFNLWEPWEQSIFLNDMVFYLFWKKIYVGLAFYFFRQLVPESIPSCTPSKSCGSSRYMQSVRIPQITIVKFVTFLKICSKYRSSWFIYTFVYKLQDISFIDIFYLQHREFLKHFIRAVIRTLIE